VHGGYYYKTETAKGVKMYSLVVRAASLEMFRETSQKYMGTEDDPQTHLQRPKFKTHSYLNIRGQLKKRLLPILLRRQFPDFARVRYVVIDEIVSETGAKLDLPIILRSKAQLAQMIQDEKMPIDPSEYIEIDDLRADILSYIEEPAVFLQNKPRKDRRRQEEHDFLIMNGLTDETLPPVMEQKPRSAAGVPVGNSAVGSGSGVLDD
jgi:hypothetical protein